MSQDLFKNLGINIAKIVNDNLGASVLDATLRKVTQTSRSAGNLTAGRQPTTADYTCKGFIDSQENQPFPDTLAKDGMKIIVLLGDSIESDQVPTTQDRVIIESTEYNIVEVDRDPASATYTLMVRPY